jgi:GT2 family glycosyltransferase
MIDVVIVNYNSTGFLLDCLKSVYESLNGISARIIIQDNGSSDGVGDILKAFPDVQLTRHLKNLGFACAVNHGIKQGTNRYIVLLNPDTIVTNGFFEDSIAFMDSHPNAGIMGPQILDPDGKIQHSARSFPSLMTAIFGRSSPISRWFPKNPLTYRNLMSLRSDGISAMEVDWVSGACMVVSRNAVNDIGLLDDRFFMYWEDADYCKRMWDAGWKVLYNPQFSIYHHVGGSSRHAVVQSVYQFHKSVYRWYEKHLPFTNAFVRPLLLAGLFFRAALVIFGKCAAGWQENTDDTH